MDDYTDTLAQIPSQSGALETLQVSVAKWITLADKIAALEAEKEALTAQVNDIRQKIIPDILDSNGITGRIDILGKTITMEDAITGSWPKDAAKREAAMQKLYEYEGAGIVKATVTVTLGRDEWGKAQTLARELASEGWTVKLEDSVHPMTLKAFARERFEAGKEIEFQPLGLYCYRQAKMRDAE